MQCCHAGEGRGWLFRISRLLFGAWFLFSGVEFFLPLGLQPLGHEVLARELTLALIHSGLFAWVKITEIVVGGLVLINRGVLPAALAVVPGTVVIVYWNLGLEHGWIELAFGLATPLLNLILLFPFRDRLIALLIWKAEPFPAK